MMLKITATQIYGFFLIIHLVSCRGEQRPDLSGIDVSIAIERFDKALDSLGAENILKKNRDWSTQYGTFYTDYMQYMLEAGDPRDSIGVANVLGEVIQTDDFKALKTAVYTKYPDLQIQEADLTYAFKYVKHAFPAAVIPQIIAFFSGFAVQTPVGEGYIGVGLDMFLGADSEFYPALRKSIPYYISRRFTPENIVPRVMESYFREDLYPQAELDVNFLQHMVYNGKILYLMDKALPDMADSLKIGYTAEQMEWATHYEREVWAWFLQEDLLYESDYHSLQKYLGEAPFTSGLGSQQESAPKLGLFIGWKIVRKFMERNPITSLPQLLAISDAQEILNSSKYRGK